MAKAYQSCRAIWASLRGEPKNHLVFGPLLGKKTMTPPSQFFTKNGLPSKQGPKTPQTKVWPRFTKGWPRFARVDQGLPGFARVCQGLLTNPGKPWQTLVNPGKPWSTLVNLGQPWSTLAKTSVNPWFVVFGTCCDLEWLAFLLLLATVVIPPQFLTKFGQCWNVCRGISRQGMVQLQNQRQFWKVEGPKDNIGFCDFGEMPRNGDFWGG